ncbi:alkaline phosphatase family protein [Streptomyces sp. NPDC092307]|uniref:alkaline phosphatase family protein n=1 Tax=Streptomyces sp. NPDC092307 TaxID=3366013 RepID=UPI00380DDABB
MSLLGQIDHLVVLMLENRSLDHMLGYLYTRQGNRSPSGQPYEGLTGKESNPDGQGGTVAVFPIDHTKPYAYFMPGADPGEGFVHTNRQLFGTGYPPSPAPGATNSGFVIDFAVALERRRREGSCVYPGTTPTDIMGCFTPQGLPVLSGLARGYAVCDHWYSSAPTETLPNRAFAHAATSLGCMDDHADVFHTRSIFRLLSERNVSWGVYGYNAQPLTRGHFPDSSHAPARHFGRFHDFTLAAAKGRLPAYSFLEPSWSPAGNSQHPNYDVAAGERFILDVYRALRSGPGWNKTLFVITYDEHGGCYDHVPPPAAVPPDDIPGEFGFDFRRFGLRVPTVLVSPLIEPGTVFRAPPGGPPLDHTSLLKTMGQRWGTPPLTARDEAAPGIGTVLTLERPRDDDPLSGVSAPVPTSVHPARASESSHLEEVHARLVARHRIPGGGIGG